MRPAILALPAIVLSACQSATIPEGDWFPLDDGLRWSYEVRDGSRTFRLDTVSLGGDVRTWSWRGRFGHEGTSGTTTDAELRAEVLEDIEVPAGRYTALRVSASYPAFGLKVTRWFTSGVGCVQVVVDRGKAPRSMRLASFSREARSRNAGSNRCTDTAPPRPPVLPCAAARQLPAAGISAGRPSPVTLRRAPTKRLPR